MAGKKSLALVAPRARNAGNAAKKQLAEFKQRSAAQRARAKATQNDQRAAIGAVIGAGVLGYTYKEGYLQRVPQLAGVPTTVTVAVVGLGVGYYAGGTLGDIGRAVGIAAAVVAAYQLASGQTVAGDSDSDVQRAVNKLASKLDQAAEGDVIVHDQPIPGGAMHI